MTQLLLFKIFYIAFFICFVLNIGWVFAILRYCKLLKIRFPRIYHLLGDPPSSIQDIIGNSAFFYSSSSVQSMITLSTAKAMIRSICFLLKKRYEPLNDAAFIKHSRWLRYYFFLSLLCMLGLLSVVGMIIYTQTA